MESTASVIGAHPCSTLARSEDAALMALARCIHAQGEQAATFAEREQAILRVTNELARRLVEADLQRLADSYPDEVMVNNVRYRHHEDGVVTYHTLCGPAVVKRATYRRVDVRNGPTIVPLEVEAGVICGATPALAYSVGQGLAEMSSRTFDSVMRGAHRALPSRSTVERLGKHIGGAVKQDALVYEAVLRAEEGIPKGAHAISVGLDRTTVPMAEERPPGQPPSTPRKPRPKSKKRKRQEPHPFDVVYRMAYVGTVAVVDDNGEALCTRKYAATAEEGPDELVRRVMADVVWLRRGRTLPVVVVQDGAPELWGLMWTALRAAGISKWHQVIDRYHVTERISAVLDEVIRDPETRKQKLDYWRRQLELRNNAVAKFADWMETTYQQSGVWKRIEGHHWYLFFAALSRRTHYRTLRDRGFPTASGVTEGACKSLIAARCKRSGQRWQQDGLTAILTLRAMVHSDRFDRLWPLFARRFVAAIDCRE
jgi:hypothetical protein